LALLGPLHKRRSQPASTVESRALPDKNRVKQQSTVKKKKEMTKYLCTRSIFSADPDAEVITEKENSIKQRIVLCTLILQKHEYFIVLACP